MLTELSSEKFEWFGPSPIEPFNLGLFIVVSFGSSLDVAAIQAGCSTKLDFDNEIMTIGVAASFAVSKHASQLHLSLPRRVTTHENGTGSGCVSVWVCVNAPT